MEHLDTLDVLDCKNEAEEKLILFCVEVADAVKGRELIEDISIEPARLWLHTNSVKIALASAGAHNPHTHASVEHVIQVDSLLKGESRRAGRLCNGIPAR